MKKLLTFVMAFIAIFLSTQSVFADYPKPTGYVNDFANALSPQFKKSEEKKLSDYTKKTTNEIAVVMVNTTGNMSIDDYAQGLADQWKVGVSGKDNGIIIVFAMQDHKDRIQTGCGLEGALSDVDAQAILDGDTRSLMRAGQTNQAVEETVNRVIARIGNSTPQPCKVGSQQAIQDARNATKTGGSTSSDSGNGMVALLVIIAIIAIIIFIIMAAASSDSGDDDSGGFGSGFGLGTLVGGIGSSLGSDDDSSSSSSDSDSGGFGGFSGGSFSGGGATGGW